MARLFLEKSAAPWSASTGQCWWNRRSGNQSLTLAVRCRLGKNLFEELALLDTGAAWSVVHEELASTLELDLTQPLEGIRIASRFGTLLGELHRIPVTLVADDGEDLEVDATIAVVTGASDNLPVVLGCRGFLERLRIAIDPGSSSGEERIHFGRIDP